jgi:hypothetical protein
MSVSMKQVQMKDIFASLLDLYFKQSQLPRLEIYQALLALASITYLSNHTLIKIDV